MLRWPESSGKMPSSMWLGKGKSGPQGETASPPTGTAPTTCPHREQEALASTRRTQDPCAGVMAKQDVHAVECHPVPKEKESRARGLPQQLSPPTVQLTREAQRSLESCPRPHSSPERSWLQNQTLGVQAAAPQLRGEGRGDSMCWEPQGQAQGSWGSTELLQGPGAALQQPLDSPAGGGARTALTQHKAQEERCQWVCHPWIGDGSWTRTETWR
ncbi:uncharacterized protein LOC125616854 isoform X6 [Marmota marmota marmota]|uniref:uncharacterized protein LOC125616854 isoform X6 n=1 Tax=Marmota marmota marmota TaxID=9994 RepID=UPI00209211DB|nr:uncharacterized protein LOC125616854 isoform X6 [Marmota marmota marmota]